MLSSSQPYETGTERQVFVDYHFIEPGYGITYWGGNDGSWEMPHGIRLAVHRPRINYEPIVSIDKPWEGSLHFHTTLFEDEGVYRLYYTPNYGGIERHGHPKNAFSYMLAYAESNDGVNWVKPELGEVEFQGSKRNNLVYGLDTALNRPTAAGTVFKDPSAQPSERYKFVHRGVDGDGNRCVYGAISPDGLHWEPIDDPILSHYMSDTQTVVAFDFYKQRYVGYFRGWSGNFDLGSGSVQGRRTIAYAETDDFRHWPVPEMIVSPETYDTPGTDIYANGYTPWPEARGHLMFPSYYERIDDIMVVRMLTSRDGIHWERPMSVPTMTTGDPGIGTAPLADWRSGVFAGAGLASLTPGEVSLPVTPTWRSHNNEGEVLEGGLASTQVTQDKRGPEPGEAAYICTATWRTDGFTSVEAESEGAFTTIPFIYPGGNLKLNTWTRFGGEVKVELAVGPENIAPRSRPVFAPVAGRSFDEADPISGDHVDHTVTWNGETDISSCAGRVVRLRFRMRRARLHSIRFV